MSAEVEAHNDNFDSILLLLIIAIHCTNKAGAMNCYN